MSGRQPGWGSLFSRHQRRSSARHCARSAMGLSRSFLLITSAAKSPTFCSRAMFTRTPSDRGFSSQRLRNSGNDADRCQAPEARFPAERAEKRPHAHLWRALCEVLGVKSTSIMPVARPLCLSACHPPDRRPRPRRSRGSMQWQARSEVSRQVFLVAGLLGGSSGEDPRVPLWRINMLNQY